LILWSLQAVAVVVHPMLVLVAAVALVVIVPA
jgi:hypothetical protein